MIGTVKIKIYPQVDLKKADIIWIIHLALEKIPKRHLKNKKVICSIYHIDFEKFDEKEKRILERDKYVESCYISKLKNNLQN